MTSRWFQKLDAMTLSPAAGKPATSAMLVNVSALVTAYYTEKPDPSVPAQRAAFGTSGHRGSALDKAFNEAHILAIDQAICLYRAHQRIDGPLFLCMDTHALSVPARASALEVMAANRVELMIADREAYTPTPAVSHAILTYNRSRTSGLADGVVITTHPRRRLQVQPSARGAGGAFGHPVDRSQGERAARRRPSRSEPDPARKGSSRLDNTPARLRHCLHERSRERDRHGRHPWGTDDAGCGPARRRGRPLLGAYRRTLQAESHHRQRGRRSDLPIHDARLGRPDSHEPLAAEITAHMDRDPGEICRDLTREFGDPAYGRVEAPATPEQKALLATLSSEDVRTRDLAGGRIQANLTTAPGNGASLGGVKVVAEYGWFAARPSGTECICKIYAESFRGTDHLRLILDEAQTIITDALAAALKSAPGGASTRTQP